MSKKKVTAPRTYNPGKGRPKEHLAYLNYQEMQALKRLNGGNQERGPRGLPSFPPADAAGSSSKASSTGARGPTGPQGQARSSPAGNKGGAPGSVSRTSTASKTTTGARGPTGPQGQARTSPAGGSPGAVSRPSGSGFSGIGGGGGGARDSGQAAARQASQSRFADTSRGGTAAVSRISGGTLGGNQRDAQFREAATSRSISKAANTPALKQDAGRSAVGGISKDKSVGIVDGSRIKGAIQGVKDLGIAGVPGGMPRVGVPAATVTTQQMRNLYSQYQQPPSPAPTKRQIAEQLQMTYPDRWGKYSLAEVENTVDKLAQSLPGEADINKYSAASMRNLAQVGINQVVRNLTPDQMLKAIDTTGMDIKRGTQKFAYPGPSSIGMTGNWADQNLARQSYETAMRSIESAIENKGVAPQARNATNFVAAGSPMVRDVRAVGSPVYGTQFGIDPVAQSAVERRNRLADMKRDYAQYRTPGADLNIVPASATPGREAVPGLISYPKLDRPTSSTAAQEAARLRGLMESYQQPPGYGKRTVDRVPTYDGGPAKSFTISPEIQGPDRKSPSIVMTDPRVNLALSDNMPGRVKRYTDRITPEFERLSEDPTIQGRTVVPSPEQSLYRGRLPSGMSFTPGLPERMPDVPIPRPRPEVQGPPRPIRGMSFTGMPDQMFAGAEVPYRPYDIRKPEFGIAAIPEPASMNMLPDVQGPPRPIGGMSFVPGLERMSYPKGFVPSVSAPTSEMVEMMRPAGPFVTTEEDPESLRYKEAVRVMSMLSGGYPTREEVEDFPEESASPSQEAASPSQDITLSPEAEEAQEEARKIAKTTRRGAQTLLNLAVAPGVGTAAGQVFKYLDGQVQKLVDAYQDAGMTERKAMEEKYPNLIPRAQAMGINSYYGMDKYNAWAEASGLRSPPSREGGGGGISDIVAGGTPRAPGGTTEPPSTQPPTQSGRRPDIYYMWDLGVNIPSPGAPNYTQYQTYLAERLAAQRAMGYV
jgi:hypothetical protein